MNTPECNLIVLRSARLDEIREFYSALGLILIQEQHDMGPQHLSCTMGKLVLEFYPASLKNPVTLVRLGFTFPHLSHIEKTAILKNAIVSKTVSSYLLEDPEGRKIQIMQG